MFDSYNSLCFKVIDKANSKFDLKIKVALHINWRKPNLNGRKSHLALTFRYSSCLPLFFSVFFFSVFLFCFFFFCVCVFLIHLLYLFIISMPLSASCRLNYTLLLLHLITTHILFHQLFSLPLL